MLCLSGIIISVLADGSRSTNTDPETSEPLVYSEDAMWEAAPRNVTVRTCDTSTLYTLLPDDDWFDAEDAALFKLSLADIDNLDASALLLALGAAMALVMKNAAVCAAPKHS